MHHSHLDIGYTHPQPLIMELQRDYIDQAVELCLKTQDYPEESKFRWTIEATYPLIKWLETASEKQIDILKELLQRGQISITALPMHTTPLCTSDQLARLMYPIKDLRKRFDIPIKTAINHDINGQPWPISQLLLDAGIEFYITGINIHFGGIPFKRPAVFYWETPDQRKLLTFLGEHYSLFSQFFHTSTGSTKRMAEGIKEYIGRLEKNGYEYDFLFLTSTNPPLYDNNCPDPNLPDLIKRYNEEDHEYKVRFVTPEMLLEKIKQNIPDEQIPTYAGDWTDYWNFGSGSSARETRINRKTKEVIKKAEFLEAFQGSPGINYDKAKHESLHYVNLYEEHTWGAANSVTEPDHSEVYSQKVHKSHMAFKAADLSAYLLGKQMEKLAGNPSQSNEPEGIILVNCSNVSQKVDLKIPEEYFAEGRHLADLRIKQYLPYAKDHLKYKDFGTVEIPPYSWRKIPFKSLETAGEQKESADYSVTENAVETPFYKMNFDPKTGRILQLLDKRRNWKMINEDSEWTFFEFVRETVDPLKNPNHRSTIFPRDIDLGNKNISVWNHSWKNRREGANRVINWQIENGKNTVSYVLELDAPGMRKLTQKITFSVLHPRIELSAFINKEDIRSPESIYFVFPLNLNKDWRCHYDTAGMFVELDAEQMGNVCRDWITVDQTVSIYDRKKGVTLACPDAPLIQIGDFNFGKESHSVPRKENPLLLCWPMNNYWDTNFWASQPGWVQFKYELTPFDQFDPKTAYELGVIAAGSAEMNVAVHCPREDSGKFLHVTGNHVVPLYIKPAKDKNGFIVTLRNLAKEPGDFSLELPHKKIANAAVVNTLEETVKEMKVVHNTVNISLKGNELIHLRVVPED